MNKAELDLEVEHFALQQALLDAKANADVDKEALTNAKRAIFEFRKKWREIRTAFQPEQADPGVARVGTIEATAPVTDLRGGK